MLIRNDPPDRYVYSTIGRATTRRPTRPCAILIKMRRILPRQIAVFAPQQDPGGDAGYAGVAKAFRTLGFSDAGILRLEYKRNTVDVDDAVNLLKAQKVPSRRWS